MSNKLNNRIYLSESKISNSYELFHKFFENLVFFRWIFFKNRPRTTFLLVRAALITSMFFSLYYLSISNFKFLLLGVDIDPVLVFSFMGVLGYWNMTQAFYQKNNYCSSLYNQVIQEKALGHHQASKILAVNLSAQLLSMDLWSHRIYSRIFVKELQESIRYAYAHKPSFKLSFTTEEDLVTAANNKQLTVAEARLLLIHFQEHLESNIEKEGAAA